MKKITIIILFLVTLFGCAGTDSTYSFPNRDMRIISIQLLHNRNVNGVGIDESNMVLLKELSEEEIPEFMNACYQLPTKIMGTPPSTGYGEYVAKILYENGDIEIFSTYNIELIPDGCKAVGCGTHYFPVKCFNDVFTEYTDVSGLPKPPIS